MERPARRHPDRMLDGAMTWRDRRIEAGMTVLEIVVVLAIIGVIAYVAGSSSINQAIFNNHVEEQAALVDVRNSVLLRFSCRHTVMPTPTECEGTSEGFLTLLDRAGNPLVKTPDTAGHSRIGPFALRARCLNCPGCEGKKLIKIEVAKLDAQEQAMRSKLNGKNQDWTDLFEGIPLGCAFPVE